MANAVPVNSTKNAASAALDAALASPTSEPRSGKVTVPPGDVTVRTQHIGDGTNQNAYESSEGTAPAVTPRGITRQDY